MRNSTQPEIPSRCQCSKRLWLQIHKPELREVDLHAGILRVDIQTSADSAGTPITNKIPVSPPVDPLTPERLGDANFLMGLTLYHTQLYPYSPGKTELHHLKATLDAIKAHWLPRPEGAEVIPFLIDGHVLRLFFSDADDGLSLWGPRPWVMKIQDHLRAGRLISTE